MAYINEETIKEIRTSNDIVEVISEYIELKQKGKNFFGVCPFHNDHSPSMSVSKEKQIYRCFTCGASGNVISFVKDYENITFVEALQKLGNRIGIKIESTEKKKNTEHDDLYKIYELSTNYYKNNLNSKSGSLAREYLANRKLNKETIDKFDIGLSLNTGLIDLLKGKYSLTTLNDIGLSTDNNKDIFKNRIMFPIKDNDGNIVAFSGRKYTDNDEAKYINSKETKIFKKGEILYNYHTAKESIKKKKEIIICEGFMDVIRLSTIGFDNAVALMGTSFTKEQEEIVRSLKVKIILNLDQDNPGKSATYTIGETINKSDTTVIVFNDAKDSDELISEFGPDKFIKAYEQRVNYIDFKLNYLKKNANLNDSVELSKFLNKAIENINQLDDDILKELKIKELVKNYDLNEELIRSKIVVQKKEEKNVVKRELNKPNKIDKYRKSEFRIIYLMLNHIEVIRKYEHELGHLINGDAKQLANEIVYYKERNHSFEYADFLSSILEKENLNKTHELVISYEQNDEYTEEELEDYFRIINEYTIKQQIEKLNQKLKESIDMEEKKKIAKRIENIKKEVLKW